MENNCTLDSGKIVSIVDGMIKGHLKELVRNSVEETLNALLEEEAKALCNAERYERSELRKDSLAGSYKRSLNPGTISYLNQKAYKNIEAWRKRPIEGDYPYVYLDGIVLKRCWAEEVRNVSILVAIGVRSDGYRQVLGIAESAKEDKAGWGGFLKHLKERGLQGVDLFISNACRGLIKSLGEYYPEAQWQRCAVHFYWNVFSLVPRGKYKKLHTCSKPLMPKKMQKQLMKKPNKSVQS